MELDNIDSRNALYIVLRLYNNRIMYYPKYKRKKNDVKLL